MNLGVIKVRVIFDIPMLALFVIHVPRQKDSRRTIDL